MNRSSLMKGSLSFGQGARVAALFGVAGCLAVAIGYGGCGSATSSGSSGSGSAASLTTTVQAPTASSANLAKAVGGKSTAADVAEAAVGAGVKCTCKKLDGTLLASATTDADGKASFHIDPSQVAAGTPVVVTAEVKGTKLSHIETIDAALSAGDSKDLGATNSDATVVAQAFLHDCEEALGSTVDPDNLSACDTLVATGKLIPKAVIASVKELLAGSTAANAGADSFQGVLVGMRLAFKHAFLQGGDPFKDLHSAWQGDATVLSQWSSLSGVALDQGIGIVQKGMAMLDDVFEDSTTYSKLAVAGTWGSVGSWLGNLDLSGVKKVIASPGVTRGLFTQAAGNYTGGDTAAFDYFRKPGAAAAIAEMGDDCGTVGSGKFAAMDAIIKQGTWDNVKTSGADTYAKAYCTMIGQAGSDAKLALMTKDPKTYAQTLFQNPDALAGSKGTAVCDNLFNLGTQGQLSGSFKPCASASDCGGQICGTFNYCVSSTVQSGATSLYFGVPCSQNSQCASGFCKSDSATGVSFCEAASGVDLASGTLKGPGQACTSNAECYTLSCSGGTCQYPSGGNSGTGTQTPPPTLDLAGTWAIQGSGTGSGCSGSPAPSGIIISGTVSPYNVTASGSSIGTITYPVNNDASACTRVMGGSACTSCAVSVSARTITNNCLACTATYLKL